MDKITRQVPANSLTAYGYFNKRIWFSFRQNVNNGCVIINRPNFSSPVSQKQISEYASNFRTFDEERVKISCTDFCIELGPSTGELAWLVFGAYGVCLAIEDIQSISGFFNEAEAYVNHLDTLSAPPDEPSETYQQFVQQTCEQDTAIGCAFEHTAECGEGMEIFQKSLRNGYDPLSMRNREHMAEELGDVLWAVQALANYLGKDIPTLCEENREKLIRRFDSQTFDTPMKDTN